MKGRNGEASALQRRVPQAQDTDGGRAAPEAYGKASPTESTESPAIKPEKDNQPDTRGAKRVDGMTARV